MYLAPDELTIYPDVRDAIANGVTATVSRAITRAVGTVKTRLAQLYDMDEELGRTGDDRNMVLVGIAIDLAVFYLYQHPETMPRHRYEAYKDSLALLKELGEGVGVLPGIPAAPPPDEPGSVVGPAAYGSRERRAGWFD